MASTQKKSASTKKTTDKKTDTKAKTKGKTKKEKPAVYAPNMVARGVGAAVCVFLTVLLVLSACHVSAVVVDFLADGVKGLVGYGIYAVIFSLVMAAWVLLFRRQKPVVLRLWCLGLLPLFVGALGHMFLSPYPYTMEFSTFSKLWTDGTHLFSGGVLGGFLSISFCTWFSAIGAGIIFVLALLLLLAGSFHLTPAAILAWNRRRRERDDEYYDGYDYDDEYYDDDPLADLPPVREEEPIFYRNSPPPGEIKPVPDMPLDKKPEPEKPKKSEKSGGLGGLFGKKSKGAEPQPEPADTISFDDPVEELPPVKEPTKAQQKEAIRQEAQKVAETIEKNKETEQKSYIYPPLDLLKAPGKEKAKAAHEELEGTLSRLASVLASFGVDGHVTGAVQGPSVTRYDVALEQGVRLNKLTNLADDVALALGVSSVRIAPVPDQISVVGIEVPNRTVIPVPIREVLDTPDFRRHKSSAAFSVGKDISGSYIIGDCATLPHLLIAGTTGSGKSVCINSLIVSMLYKSTPEELKLIMVDPKMVELGGYNGIPHLLIPVVTDPKKAAGALQWAVTEMMKRYRLFAEAGVRDLAGYNQWAKKNDRETLAKVVIVIDELADLMLVAAKEVEESICRVAQMGRASGMHLVIATQRPSADVITGLMKANIPSRIAFAVASSLESRIILDQTGAEKLVGKGDMLWYPLGSGKPRRVQGCFISDEEVASVVEKVKENATAQYDDDILEQIEQHVSESEKKGKGSGSGGFPGGDGPEGRDELFNEAVEVTLDLGQASVSMLQRRLKLGYARAARLVDQMEQEGIVGPFEGSKPRQLLITKEQWSALQGGGENPPVEEELFDFDDAVPQAYLDE
ncbi:MAG: DNA translocase FtsK [Ruminiclostridium sp.]|nr:DNA translocase FtsK [Ruminiclostridium sp.]MBQ9933918.1 DNA translocase FtsK [Ruminiclostridium sp.]